MRLVENPEADRLAEENEQLKLETLGLEQARGRRSGRLGTDVWRASFPKPGLARPGVVERVRTYPELGWEERVRLGDQKVLHDDLGVVPQLGAGTYEVHRLDLPESDKIVS